MLTTEDFHHNLQIINFCCKLGIFPLQLNPQNQQLELVDSTWKRAICYSRFALFAIHTGYVVGRLPYLLFIGVQLPLLSVLVHFTMICGMIAILFWHFLAFFCYPGITATCFNKAFETWGLLKEGSFSKKLKYFFKNFLLSHI